jgi:hypothetical protein
LHLNAGLQPGLALPAPSNDHIPLSGAVLPSEI